MKKWIGVSCVLGLAVGVLAGCDGGSEDNGGGGGAGGEGGGEGCVSEGKGTISLKIEGLPDGVAAEVEITGPGLSDTVNASAEFEDVGAGTFTVTASRVFDEDPIVRTLFEPSPASGEYCVVDGKTQTITITYSAHPASNKLWTNNANGTGAVLGFASELLASSDTVEPSVSLDGQAGNEVVFDRDGNLWSVDGANVVRYPAATLGSSGDKTPDRQIEIADIPCLPYLRALAFDASGALWASVCGGEVVRLSPDDLARSGTVEPAVVLSEITENVDLAFDSDDNLWVTSDFKIARFDKSRLSESTSEAADLLLTVQNAAELQLQASNLAFAADGTLWAVDWAGNHVFAVAASDLDQTGEVTVAADVEVTLGVLALLERPAFDEGGGLWLALDQGRFGRLSPAQLAASAETINPETIIESAAIGNANRVAFFPAPADLPLFHALP